MTKIARLKPKKFTVVNRVLVENGAKEHEDREGNKVKRLVVSEYPVTILY